MYKYKLKARARLKPFWVGDSGATSSCQNSFSITIQLSTPSTPKFSAHFTVKNAYTFVATEQALAAHVYFIKVIHGNVGSGN